MGDVIKIKLPELAIEDIEPCKCFRCGSTMIPGLASYIYPYQGQRYRVSCIRVWKCLECRDTEIYTSTEAARIEYAIRKKMEDSNDLYS